MEKSIESSQNLSSSALLQGQVVLITGASRGIGAATALLLALPDQQLPGCWWWQLLALMLMRRSAHFTRFFETGCTSHLLGRERNFSSMQAIVIDPQAPMRLGFQTVEAPQPQANEAVIRVKAISLNRGEVMYLVQGAAGTRLGWDLAGVVEQAATDGSGPAQGTRVVGVCMSPPGAWAEQVAVPTNALAELPPSVSFAQAAALPVAGLTALYATQQVGSLIARPVLVTGASGGVGLFACRLAALAGAQVVGQVRQASSVSLVQEAGADLVVVDENITATAAYGPYHLIIDQLGGRTLAEAMTQLAPGGTCVSVGALAGSNVPLDYARVRQVPGASLDFFNLWFEFRREPASLGLGRLVYLVSTEKLTPPLGMEADWHEISRVAQTLIDRQFPGKAVLHIS